MSQQLIPTTGGTEVIQTTTTQTRLNALSPQYIQAKGLESRSTEWVADGRPIYRRLPAISETYQFDFFNVVPLANSTGIDLARENVGFVYIPWGEGINGPTSIEVISSDDHSSILIKAGNIVWQYGTNPIRPAIINLKELDIGSGSYTVAYRLIYDDSPVENLYSVENFALTGLPLTITSSTDSVIGWRYPAENSFLNTPGTFWKNQDSLFPTYAQPIDSFIQWSSTLASAFTQITLRCPSGTAYTGTAALSYVTNGVTFPVRTTSIASDETGQFFQFDVSNATFQTGWKVEWSSLDMAIESITVTGSVTRLTKPTASSTQCVLVIYPEDELPLTIQNSLGVDVPATYCLLANVDINAKYELTDIRDKRYIVHRDYTPVADWLTLPFDQDLIDLYEIVKKYEVTWLDPKTCMKQEYAALTKTDVVVEN
jgi:hypothetical protein